MPWPFRKSAPPPEQKSLSFGGFYFGSPLLAPASASYARLAREGYGQNAVAFACANKIATAVASVELQLFRQKGDDVERVMQSPLLDLIDNPNQMQSYREFMGHLASYFVLSGNAYVQGSGLDGRFQSKQPKELFLLSPGHMTVEPGQYMGIPAKYVYEPNGNTRHEYPVDATSARSAVLHLKTFNPLSPWYGMAPMDAAALAIDLHNAGNTWNYSLLKHGARPSGALVVKAKDGQPSTLSDDQFVKLKQQMDEFSGVGNSGKPLLLEGGLEWQEMSINPKDMEFLEGMNAAARQIALAFGMPPMLLGIPGDATYSNMAEARLALYTDTVLPLIQLIAGGLNRWLTPLYGEGLYLWYDEEMIPALEPLRKAKSERINSDATKTVNEKREAMGDDDIGPEGDVILVSSTSVPLSLIGDPGLSELDSEEPKPEEDEPEEGEPE